MQIVFANFKWDLKEASCDCYRFKRSNVLDYVGTIKAKDGDGLSATCVLVEMIDSESELKSKFGPKKILFAYGHSLCQYRHDKGNMDKSGTTDLKASAADLRKHVEMRRQLRRDDLVDEAYDALYGSLQFKEEND